MPPDTGREQRRLERQRGAGKRDVVNTSGFDLIIPGQDDAPQSGPSRKTPHSETKLPQRSSVQTPTADIDAAPSSSLLGQLRPPFEKNALAGVVTGKRKRPTGEAIFDVPGSPGLEVVAEEYVGELDEDAPVDENIWNDDGSPDAERNSGTLNVLESMSVNGNATRKPAVKKRKKRKSIGQQSTKRAKAKTSPTQKRITSEVKPEPISPESSRLHTYEEAIPDPAEAQIQLEFAGAAEQGLHESLAGDTEDDRHERGVETNDRKPRQESRKDTRKPKKQMRKMSPDENHQATSSHIYSLPISAPPEPDDELEASDEDERVKREDDDENEDGPDEDSQEETDGGYQNIKNPSPSHQPLKPKRKKRKSIGQQRPKRPSTAPPPRPSQTARPAPPRTHPPTNNPSRRAPPANSIPITIYRPLPPSPPSRTPSTAPDPLTLPLYPPPTTTLTSIDILSQLTREILSKHSTNPSLSHRAQRTIALYGSELDRRMKQLGQAMATNSGLARRLREVRKEERRVREEIRAGEEELGGVREGVEGARGVGAGRRLGGLMEGLRGVVGRGWAREREREREGGVG